MQPRTAAGLATKIDSYHFDIFHLVPPSMYVCSMEAGGWPVGVSGLEILVVRDRGSKFYNFFSFLSLLPDLMTII